MDDAILARADDCRPRVGSKPETIRRLYESALQMFAMRGFDGASLRDIAAGADVPLSTINRYFGSKLDLINELETRIWRDVNRDRDLLLKSPIRVDAEGRPTLEAVLYAFVRPVVVLGIGEGRRGRPALRLLREYAAMRVHSGLPNSFTIVAARWAQAIHAARPHLSRAQAVWALSFTVGVTFSDQLQHGWYDEIMPGGEEISADQLTRTIVGFCEAGIDRIAALDQADLPAR